MIRSNIHFFRYKLIIATALAAIAFPLLAQADPVAELDEVALTEDLSLLESYGQDYEQKLGYLLTHDEEVCDAALSGPLEVTTQGTCLRSNASAFRFVTMDGQEFDIDAVISEDIPSGLVTFAATLPQNAINQGYLSPEQLELFFTEIPSVDQEPEWYSWYGQRYYWGGWYNRGWYGGGWNYHHRSYYSPYRYYSSYNYYPRYHYSYPRYRRYGWW